MATAIQAPPDPPEAPVLADGQAERRFLLRGVPWETYVALRDALDDQSGLKMTYLEGALELMSPSTLREVAKTIIARLLEAWAVETNLDLDGIGGATFRSEAMRRGLEPDECYKLGQLNDGDVPDIALEIIVASGLVDKLDVYAGLAVPEVWTWRPTTRAIVVHRLNGSTYEQQAQSSVLPQLDLELLTRFVRPGERQTALVKSYVAALRAR
jgi:Uma2 family endonuclease